MAILNVVRLIVLSIIIVGIIFFLVHTSMESSWSGGYWESILANNFQLSPELAHCLIFLLRKTIHLIGYGLFGLLFWYYYYLWELGPKSLFVAWVSILSVASLDEYVQLRSGFRTGSPWDVLLDLCGAVVVSLIVSWIFFKKPTEN